MQLEFVECDNCSSRPGAALLCIGCTHNRTVIQELVKDAAEKIEKGAPAPVFDLELQAIARIEEIVNSLPAEPVRLRVLRFVEDRTGVRKYEL
jgi:hypothetical protein